MQVHEGWEGAFLWSLESTPGTLVTPATALGYTKNVNFNINANIEEEGAIGTYLPISLEEGLIEAGGTCESLITLISSLAVAKRNGSGKLPNHSLHVSGGAGDNVNAADFVGAKINSVRGRLDAGNRFRVTFDWMALAGWAVTPIAAVIPTDEIFGWYEAAHSLNGIIYDIEFTINHNLVRRPVIRGADTVMPVVNPTDGTKKLMRTPFIIREGRQTIELTMRFAEQPTYTLWDNLIAMLTEIDLTLTGSGAVTPPVMIWKFLNGKPTRKEVNLSENAEEGWPQTFRFTAWDCAAT